MTSKFPKIFSRFFSSNQNNIERKSSNILVLNCGSSSIKFQIIDPVSKQVALKGKLNIIWHTNKYCHLLISECRIADSERLDFFAKNKKLIMLHLGHIIRWVRGHQFQITTDTWHWVMITLLLYSCCCVGGQKSIAIDMNLYSGNLCHKFECWLVIWIQLPQVLNFMYSQTWT